MLSDGKLTVHKHSIKYARIRVLLTCIFQYKKQFWILFLYGNIRVCKNPFSRIFFSVKCLKYWKDCVHYIKALRKKIPYSEFFWYVFYSVYLRIQSECGKIRTRKTPSTDTFCAVKINNQLPINDV